MQVGAVVPGASRQGASDWGTAALHDMVASTSLLLMLGLRKWLHKPMCAVAQCRNSHQCYRILTQVCVLGDLDQLSHSHVQIQVLHTHTAGR